MCELVPQALLAPVPEVLLLSGQDVCQRQGRVAFGSRAWQVLKKFDEQSGEGSTVVIYASHPARNRGPVATWRARWLRWELTDGAPHPEGDLIRPATAADHGEDGAGYWVGFWEVTDLQPLEIGQWVKTSRLVNLHGRKLCAFVPEGPILLGADPYAQ